MTRKYGGADPAIVRAARRAWFRAGVRRGDRARLTSDLVSELDGAGDPAVVLGDDPSSTAREWAEAQGLTDRRSRIAMLAPAMLLSGLVAGCAVLVPLAQAFGNGGHSFMNGLTAWGVVAVYCGGALLAYVAMLTVCTAVLSAVADAHRGRTIKLMATALPVGAVFACLGGVGAAAVLHYDVRPATFVLVAVVVSLVVLATVAAVRLLVTRYEPARSGLPSRAS